MKFFTHKMKLVTNNLLIHTGVDMNSNKRFQTKKQLVQRLQEGIAFDDGEDYTPEEYMEMANEFTTQWRNKHYPNDSDSSKTGEKKEKMTYHNLEQDYWNLVETNLEVS